MKRFYLLAILVLFFTSCSLFNKEELTSSGSIDKTVVENSSTGVLDKEVLDENKNKPSSNSGVIINNSGSNELDSGVIKEDIDNLDIDLNTKTSSGTSGNDDIKEFEEDLNYLFELIENENAN